MNLISLELKLNTSCCQRHEVLNYKSLKLWSYFIHSISIAAMASKGTPKKFYRKGTESTAVSRCRLCNCVTDPGHSKNLFREQNRKILRNAEIVYGNELRQDNNLPHLACAPCVRRLNNFIQFKNIVTETQRLLQEDTRAKRCVEISPSVAKPSAKVRATGTSRRRSIDFDIAIGDQSTETAAPTSLALHVSIFYLCVYLRNIQRY